MWAAGPGACCGDPNPGHTPAGQSLWLCRVSGQHRRSAQLSSPGCGVATSLEAPGLALQPLGGALSPEFALTGSRFCFKQRLFYLGIAFLFLFFSSGFANACTYSWRRVIPDSAVGLSTPNTIPLSPKMQLRGRESWAQDGIQWHLLLPVPLQPVWDLQMR